MRNADFVFCPHLSGLVQLMWARMKEDIDRNSCQRLAMSDDMFHTCVILLESDCNTVDIETLPMACLAIQRVMLVMRLHAGLDRSLPFHILNENCTSLLQAIERRHDDYLQRRKAMVAQMREKHQARIAQHTAS